MKKIYIIGDDKIGRYAMNSLSEKNIIIRNQSTNFIRVIKLILRKVVSLSDVLKMIVAEHRRKRHFTEKFSIIKNNSELMKCIIKEEPTHVICFRAGLIINKKVLKLGPKFFNIHCADLPKYPGIGSILKSLRDQCYEQNACLHEMLPEIDKGRVIYKEPYTLSKESSLLTNEDLAYEAGIKILLKIEKNQMLI